MGQFLYFILVFFINISEVFTFLKYWGSINMQDSINTCKNLQSHLNEKLFSEIGTRLQNKINRKCNALHYLLQMMLSDNFFINILKYIFLI